MSHARKANPKCDMGPDYFLLCCGVMPTKKAPADYVGHLYAGLTDGGCSTWSTGTSQAKKLKGPGLASAERALKRRGYIVERVRVEG